MSRLHINNKANLHDTAALPKAAILGRLGYSLYHELALKTTAAFSAGFATVSPSAWISSLVLLSPESCMLELNAAVLVEELLLHLSAEPSIVHVLFASPLSSTRGAEQEAAFTAPHVNRPAFAALSSFLIAFRSVETMAGPAVTRKNCSSEESAQPHQYQYVYNIVGS